MDPFEILEQFADTLKERAARLAADPNVPDGAATAGQLDRQADYLKSVRGTFGPLLAQARQPVRNPFDVNAALDRPAAEILEQFHHEFGLPTEQRRALVQSLLRGLEAKRPAPAAGGDVDREIWKDLDAE